MHIAPLIKEFSKNNSVEIVFEKKLPEWREKMGFIFPDFGSSKLYICPDRNTREEIVSRASVNGSINIFHGLYKYPNNYRNLRQLVSKKSIVGLHLEPMPITGSTKAFMRKYLYFVLLRYWRNRIDFLLTHGALGFSHYEKLGVCSKKIFEFGYFGTSLTIPENYLLEPIKKDKINIIYVGQIIDRKNVQIILEALHLLRNQFETWELNIVGTGSELARLGKIAKDLDFEKKIFFHGNLSNTQILKYYEKSHFLILPSNFEPWGAVTNEALSLGRPVIVSNRCGSSVLAFGNLGLVFKAGDKYSLASAIGEAVAIVKNDGEEGFAIRQRTFSKIASEKVGAKYLREILEYVSNEKHEYSVKPKAPWRSML